MAAAPDPDEVLTSTREKENFQRLARLLISGGTSLMREIFDKLCLPSNLPTILKNPAVEKKLKAAKLTKPQWDCLYPSTGVYGKSADFDVTLLFRLLRTICSITPPVTGWDALPTSTDHSLAAEIVRIKYYRNSVYGHVSQSMEITDDKFPKLWKDIREALLGIAGQISPAKKTAWQDAIDNFLKDPLTAEDERNVQELLRWYRKDIEVKECIETSAHKMREGMEISVREEAQDIKDQLGGELKTASQEVQSLVREEARDIKDQLGGELKTTSQEIKDQLGEELKTTSEDVQSLVREEAQGIKDQLGEMHQSIDRLSSSADCRQPAQIRLRIDCEAISGPGPRTGSSEMLATAREPQANVTAMPVTSFQQQVSVPASFGAEIVPKTNLPDTQGVLNLIMFKYLQNVNPSTEEEFNAFLSYMTDVRQVAIVDTKLGSLIITVECSSLKILEGLWEDYRTGHLNDMAQKYLVTEDILKELGLVEVRLMTTILEDEYRACREYFLQKPGIVKSNYHSWKSIRESLFNMGDFSEWEIIEMAELKKEIEESGVSHIEELEFLRKRLEKWREVEVNIAITGDSGSGKSSFINAIRELYEDDEGAAPVDVTECTREPTPFDHPTNTNIKFWDLPGIGTPDYPDLETYCEKVQLEKYHTYLIFTATRFTKNDLELANKVRSIDKKFFFIRTKIDESVRAERRKRSFDEEAMLTKIRLNCLESLGDLLTDEQDIFLISNHEPEKWEFVRLTQAILDALTRYQRESMTLSLGKVITRSSNEIFQRKVDVLRGRIWKVASASGVAAAIPVPGLSFAVDGALILRELSLYRTQLGLPEIDSAEFARLHLATREKVVSVSLTTAAQLSPFLAPYAAEAVVEEATRYIPFIGLAIASGLSFGATYYALNRLLTNVEEAAKLVLKEAAEKTAADLELEVD